MKRDKGEFGYIKSQKIKRGLITLVMFCNPDHHFSDRAFITKTRLEYVYLCGDHRVYPGSQSSKPGLSSDADAKPASEALKEKIEQVNENVRILYDMTFTAYQKTVPVDAVAVSGTQVIGYVSSEKADLLFGEEHIREILKNNKCKSVGVKLFREEKRFLDQLKQMNQKQSEHETTGQPEGRIYLRRAACDRTLTKIRQQRGLRNIRLTTVKYRERKSNERTCDLKVRGRAAF